MAHSPPTTTSNSTFSIQPYTGADGLPLRYGLLSSPWASESETDTRQPLVYLPGLGGSVKSALWFLEGLLDTFHPIYGLDCRGFGLNANQPERLHSLKPTLADMQVFLGETGPLAGQTPHLIGISMGATLATILSAREPERFKSLLFLAPAYRPHPKTFSWRYKFKNMLGKLLLGKRFKTKLPYTLSMLTRNEAILNDPQYHKTPSAHMTAEMLVSARHFCEAGLEQSAQLKPPIMMVIPGQDKVCDPLAMHEGFKRLADETPKRLLDLPEYYHNVLMEPEAPVILDAYRRWVQRHL
jgi:alpha-beta hydrolase superfamily lysophospholipase